MLRRLTGLLSDPRVSGALLALYAVALLFVVFQPLPHAAVGSVHLGDRVVRWLHLSGWIGPAVVEFLLNVVLFVPATFLAGFLWPRVAWEAWAGAALLGSGTIEYLQLFLLPGRSAQVRDLVSNTLGGVLGALLASWAQDRGR